MKDLRIISFLPAATEMVCALGLFDQLVGVTHECDYPPTVRRKPKVVRSAIPSESISAREIDVAVSQRLASGAGLYEVDEQLLKRLAPTHIVTQALCQVCAPSGNEIARVLDALSVKPQVLWFTPRSIDDIFDNLRQLGRATGCELQAEAIIADARVRLQRIFALIRGQPRPRVLFLEWTDPFYCSGHWVPEMVEAAGGLDVLGRRESDSARVSWNEIDASSPEVVVVAPCGFNTGKSALLTKDLLRQPGWNDLPAVRNGRVFAVDANSYFARPGPRVVEGVELLAHLFHPGVCFWKGSPTAFTQAT